MKADRTMDERILDVMEEQIGCARDVLTPMASLVDDVGVDSLDFVELVMALEAEFGIELADEDTDPFVTVNDLRHAVLLRINERVARESRS